MTRLAGRNAGYPSPDGRHLAFMHSNDTSPTELYVVSSEGGDATRVTHSPLPAFAERTWVAAEYVSFSSLVDDYTLHARILKPHQHGAWHEVSGAFWARVFEYGEEPLGR